MSKFKNYIIFLLLLPVITGVILGVSALPSKLWPLNFIAFIPLLIASEFALASKKPFLIFLLQLMISLVVFYSIVYYWVLQTAHLGFLIGFIIVLPYLLLISPYIYIKKRGNKYAPLYFIAAWLGTEFIQSYFQLGSPFYTLGNNLGVNPRLIQWYEFTGAAGGTLWILAGNFAILSAGKTLVNNSKRWVKRIAIALGILLLPFTLSLIIFYTYKDKGLKTEVLVIHPSTDCAAVKYRINIYELMDIYLKIMLPQITEKTEYVVLPETAITNAGWVADLNNNLVFDHFKSQTTAFPRLKLVTGAIIYEAIPNVEKINGYKKIPGIRYSEKYNTWYYTYSSALQIAKNLPVQMRTKDGLVPYQEYAPYPRVIPHIAPVGIDFQFSIREKNKQVFIAENNTKTAALICYELVYGRLFSKAAKKGAEAFFVLLNEGWYIDPKVPQQFLQLSVVRAVENRRYIAHSSNMGISAFINQKGEVISTQKSKEPAFLKQEIRLNNKITVSATSGNYLGVTSLISVILMLFIEHRRKN